MSDTPKADQPASTELSDNDLGDISGGNLFSMIQMPAHLNIFQRFSFEHFRPSILFKNPVLDPIHGPSWVKTMTYRKAGAASEPSASVSVTELFAKLSAEEAGAS